MVFWRIDVEVNFAAPLFNIDIFLSWILDYPFIVKIVKLDGNDCFH